MSKEVNYSVRVCKENNWQIGDILECNDYVRIRITAIGEQRILARGVSRKVKIGFRYYWKHVQLVERVWDLSIIQWHKVGGNKDVPPLENVGKGMAFEITMDKPKDVD